MRHGKLEPRLSVPHGCEKGQRAGMLCYPDRIESFLEKTMPAIKRIIDKAQDRLKYPDEVLQLIRFSINIRLRN